MFLFHSFIVWKDGTGHSPESIPALLADKLKAFCTNLGVKWIKPAIPNPSVMPARVVNKNGGFLRRLSKTRGTCFTSGLVGVFTSCLVVFPLCNWDMRVSRTLLAAGNN